MRGVTMARFDETISEPTAVMDCAKCEEAIYAGDDVIRSYDAEIVHDECWREYCDMIYREKRGTITKRGDVE